MSILKFKEFLIKERQEKALIEMMNLDQRLGLYDKIYEGGAYGHLSHPFDDLDLNMSDLKEMISAAVNASFSPENFIQEKTDGMQLSITWKDNEVKAARNKSQLKNFGEQSLNINGISTLFAGRGNIEVAFTKAIEDLNSSLGSLSEKDKLRFFNNGRKFASIEIITPMTQNTVPYGQNMIVFHGVIEYDIEGNPIDEDKQAGIEIGKIIKNTNADIQKLFYIRGPHDISLEPLPDTKKRESYYVSKLNKIMKEGGVNINSSVRDYIIGNSKRLLDELASNDNINIPAIYLESLGRRIGGIDKSFTESQIKKNLEPDVSEWYLSLEKSQGKYLKKRVYQPIESLFLELGTEIMKNIKSFLTANPTEAAEYMKKEIENVIRTVRKDGGEEDIKKLEYELEKVSSLGGLESIVPSEGITFVYKGKLYKFTGIFSAIHQIRSILAYKK